MFSTNCSHVSHFIQPITWSNAEPLQLRSILTGTGPVYVHVYTSKYVRTYLYLHSPSCLPLLSFDTSDTASVKTKRLTTKTDLVVQTTSWSSAPSRCHESICRPCRPSPNKPHVLATCTCISAQKEQTPHVCRERIYVRIGRGDRVLGIL